MSDNERDSVGFVWAQLQDTARFGASPECETVRGRRRSSRGLGGARRKSTAKSEWMRTGLSNAAHTEQQRLVYSSVGNRYNPKSGRTRGEQARGVIETSQREDGYHLITLQLWQGCGTQRHYDENTVGCECTEKQAKARRGRKKAVQHKSGERDLGFDHASRVLP